MARADQLIDIVRAGSDGNQELFRRLPLPDRWRASSGARRRGLKPLRQQMPVTN
jgi:hypothetical protein